MRQSMKALKEGKHLVIFPEQPSGFGEHHSWINTGWLNVCTMFYRATGKNLTLYPVHIDQKKHCFEVQKPVMFDGNRTLEEQQDELVKHGAARAACSRIILILILIETMSFASHLFAPALPE